MENTSSKTAEQDIWLVDLSCAYPIAQITIFKGS